MKRVLLLFICLAFTVVLFAQETTNEPKSQSKSVEYMSKMGSFILKEFYDLGKVKGVKCQVLIMTNIRDNTKMGCLRLGTGSSPYYSYNAWYKSPDSNIGIIDIDELDACIQSLKYFSNTLLPSKPAVYTEAEYRTRDKVRLGVFYKEEDSSWHAYVYTTYYSRSFASLDATDIPSLISVMEQAKKLIKEKTIK